MDIENRKQKIHEIDSQLLTAMEDFTMPTRGTKNSACIDLYARKKVSIDRGSVGIVPLGVKINQSNVKKVSGYLFGDSNYIHENFYMSLHPRSGKRAGGYVSNTGIIDMDYEDEIKIILVNSTSSIKKIEKGEKIAQIMLKRQETDLFGIFSDKKRTGGFGSTGN